MPGMWALECVGARRGAARISRSGGRDGVRCISYTGTITQTMRHSELRLQLAFHLCPAGYGRYTNLEMRLNAASNRFSVSCTGLLLPASNLGFCSRYIDGSKWLNSGISCGRSRK